VSGQQHAPAALYPRERPGTHFTGGWVGPRAGLDGRKISSPPEFDPGPSSPVVQSLYRLSYWAHTHISVYTHIPLIYNVFSNNNVYCFNIIGFVVIWFCFVN
jgi:hypothetical protein